MFYQYRETDSSEPPDQDCFGVTAWRLHSIIHYPLAVRFLWERVFQNRERPRDKKLGRPITGRSLEQQIINLVFASETPISKKAIHEGTKVKGSPPMYSTLGTVLQKLVTSRKIRRVGTALYAKPAEAA